MADRVTAFRYLRKLLHNIIREIRGGSLEPNTVDALHLRLDWLHGLIARLVHLYRIDKRILNLMRGARDCRIGSQNIFSVSSPASAFTGQRRRPRYSIPRDQLEFLISRCFSVVDIATLLGVSVRTVERIREAMRRVNPAGVLLRALELRTIRRRQYQVHGPLALWHIDGNHKQFGRMPVLEEATTSRFYCFAK